MNLSQKTRGWLYAIGYVLFIYLTLGIVPGPMKVLRESGMLGVSLHVLYGLVFFFLLLALKIRKIFSYKRVMALFFLGFCYLLISKGVTSPEEKIHFLQYGLVGVFFANALSPHVSSDVKKITLALLIATLVGYVDELIQGILPNRHFDYRDVALNFISSLMGLGAYLTFQKGGLAKGFDTD